MIKASFALKTASNVLVPIVSTLVAPSLLTTRISHCLLHPQVLIFRMTSKFAYQPEVMNSMHLQSYHTPTFKTSFSLGAPEFNQINLRGEGTLRGRRLLEMGV